MTSPRALVIGLTLVVGQSFSFAEPVTLTRVNELPPAERPGWKDYLERSEANARADTAAVEAELAVNGMTKTLRAPEGGDFKRPAEPGDAWYAGDEAGQLATTVLSYQTPSGGWSKH